MQNQMSSQSSTDSSAKETPKGLASAVEAVSSIEHFGSSLRDFVNSLHAKNQELERESERRRELDTQLETRIREANNLSRELAAKEARLVEMERKYNLIEETKRRTETDLEARTETLASARRELSQTLDALHKLETQVGTIGSELNEIKRAKDFSDESVKSLEQVLAAKTKEFDLARTSFLKTEASYLEAQAKLKDTNDELEIAKAELQKQAEELKNVKWQLHEHRETLRVTSSELARKNDIHSQLEGQLRDVEKNLREHHEQISEKQSALDISARQLGEREELLQRANVKIEEQAGSLRTHRDQVSDLEDALRKERDKLRKVEEVELRQRQELETKTARLEELSRQLEEQQTVATNSGREARSLAEKFKEESKIRQDHEQGLERSKTEIQGLKTQVAKLYHDIEIAEASRKEFEEDLQETRTKLDQSLYAQKETQQKLDRSEELLERTKTELDSQVLKARNLHSENARLLEKEEVLTMKFDRLRVSLSDAQHTLSKQRESLDLLNTAYRQHPRVEQLERELADLKQQLRRSEARYSALEVTDARPSNEGADSELKKKLAQVKPLTR